MGSTSSGGSSTTVSISKTSTKLTVELREKNISKNRHATNKSWSIFFIVAFTSWIASSYDVIYYGTTNDILPANTIFSDYLHNYIRKEAIDNTIRDYDEIPTNITEYFDNEIANISNITADILEEEKKLKKKIESLRLLFSIYTCNPSNLRDVSANNENEIAILGYTVFSIMFLSFALMDMVLNNIIYKQPWMVCATFVFVVFLEHVSAALYASNSTVFSPFPTHERLALWMIPELLFLVILSSQLFSSVRSENNDDSIAIDDNDSGNESDNDLDNDSENYWQRHLNNENIPFSTYIPAMAIGVPIILILKILMISTMIILYKTSFLDGRFYIIAIGSIYVGRTIFYFGLMVTSYASSIANKDSSSSVCSILRNALFIIARYHFGTACYHATLILPKFSANSVMSESGWKPLIKEHQKQKFSVKYGKMFKLSKTLTAVYGTNHSQSVRNLLRLYCRDLITETSFPGFQPLSISLLVFLLATNCILIILLWSLGVVDDDFAMATWVMYLQMSFVFSLAFAFFTSTMDAIKLSGMRKVLENFSDEELYKEIVMLTANDDQLSDDEQIV